MTVQSGTRLGPYEVIAPLGSGGMGEVYRARDTRLAREVAIKVLPQHLSSSPELRARFEREAKTVSSLNHPNICVLHDVGREGDIDYLVMELVDGETLAARIARGSLPTGEVLRIGSQIADALDRAHRAGVIHRDLKPGNIMLTKSGAKLMDFGLARATGLAGPAGGSGVTVAALTQSPTVAQPLTAEGTLVGTFQYMSPEQLEGKEADARSDLWALGCVLYEMSTGMRAFEGKSQASLIGAIMNQQPTPISHAVPMMPPALDRLVQACLAKDPDERIQTAHDVKLQLGWLAGEGTQSGISAPPTVAPGARARGGLGWGVAALLAAALIAWIGVTLLRRPAPPRVTRFEVGMPRGVANMTWPRISPDGRLLAMIATDTAGVASIWIRPLDALEAHLLPGTTGSGRPFWSPDSRYLAYFTEGKLRKVAVAGGPPVVVCDALGAADGDWGSRDIIVFDGSSSDSIRWVSASGGAVHAASSFDRSKHETQHAWPHFLPDGRHFLYQASGTGDDGAIKVGSLDSKESRELGRTDGRVEFARDGYILFPRGGTLMVQPFDPRSLKTTGDAVPFGEHLTMGGSVGFFSSSDDGVLAYGLEDAVQKSQLQWVDRAGRTLARIGATAQYRDLALSPDGKRVAIGMGTVEGAGEDIWVLDLSRGVGSRLTFGDGNNIWPIWTPDGSRVVYCNNRGGEFRLMTRLANGQGGVDSLAHARGGQDGPSDWSGDGRYVALSRFGATSWDVSMLPQFGERKPYDLLATPFRERDARFSPDGRWLAYSSNESGRSEVYVTSFPGPGGKWQVSTGGGEQPYWRSDGREIFYRSLDQGIMAVPIQAGAAPDVGTPVELFKTVLEGGGFVRNRWMPAADGQRFLLDVPSGAPTGARFAIVTNWAEELKRR